MFDPTRLLTLFSTTIIKQRLKYAIEKQYNNSEPPPNSGSFAFNDTLHIVSGSGGIPILHAHSLNENKTHPYQSSVKQLWNISTLTLVEAKVQTAFGDVLAYYVESEGALVCIDTITGTEQWRYRTRGRVRADFVILDDTYLVFATTNGYTSLLRIGEMVSESPSAAPTIYVSIATSVKDSVFPTVMSSSWPSARPTVSLSGLPSKDYTTSPSSKPTMEPLTPFPTPSGTPFPTVQDSNEPSEAMTSEPSKAVTTRPSINTVEESTGSAFKEENSAASMNGLLCLNMVAFAAWLVW